MEDLKKIEQYTISYRLGAITLNELRFALDLPALDNGNMFYKQPLDNADGERDSMVEAFAQDIANQALKILMTKLIPNSMPQIVKQLGSAAPEEGEIKGFSGA